MDEQNETALNDNYSFAKMTCSPDRQFADQAITLTVEGLFDRGVSQYHVAKSLFDMALSLAAGGRNKSNDDTENWWYLLEYFCDTSHVQRKILKDALLGDNT